MTGMGVVAVVGTWAVIVAGMLTMVMVMAMVMVMVMVMSVRNGARRG